MTINKRFITYAIIVGVIIVAGGVWIALTNKARSNTDSHAIVSQQQRITLYEPKNSDRINNSSQIAGAYQPQQDEALLYTISNKDGAILGGGTIVADDKNNFSRNIAFTTKPQNNDELTLVILVQDKQGGVLDKLEVSVTYHD